MFAVRQPGEQHDLTGLPELVVHGLAKRDARALLTSVVAGPLDEQVRDRIVAETRGNPGALLELASGLTPDGLAGGFGRPDASAWPGRAEEGFRSRLGALPAGTRRLLLIAAAEPVGDPLLVWRAAARIGITIGATAPAAEAGLIEPGEQVQFRHPLVRSAVYRAASAQDRRDVHRALAAATAPGADPDRRAWHRAHATAGPDEKVAAELERSADRAQARGGLAAAAAFYARAADLTAGRPARPGGRWPPRRPNTRPVRPTRRCGCWPGRARGRWTSWAVRVRNCCAHRPGPTRAAAATQRRGCSRRPDAWNRCTPGLLVRPTATRSRRR